MKVYIGYDGLEDEAFRVVVSSLQRHAKVPVEVTALYFDRLSASGLLNRCVDRRGGKIYDLFSNAPWSTDFAVSRFLVPILAQTGWALFVDCDMVFQEDVGELLTLADPSKAVMVVKHNHVPSRESKMAGKEQVRYNRKNWSSVMLFNCDHLANRRLTLDDINRRPGRDLHSFFWLSDEEIGELPQGWNWLVDEQPKPDKVCIAHFTNGGPWLKGWSLQPSDALWLEESGK